MKPKATHASTNVVSTLPMQPKPSLTPKRIVRADLRHSYGEERFKLLGAIDSRIFVVVYTPRPQATRIISARKANTREVKHYENGTHED
jgi:uncharacterized DUF497 family protein